MSSPLTPQQPSFDQTGHLPPVAMVSLPADSIEFTEAGKYFQELNSNLSSLQLDASQGGFSLDATTSPVHHSMPLSGHDPVAKLASRSIKPLPKKYAYLEPDSSVSKPSTSTSPSPSSSFPSSVVVHLPPSSSSSNVPKPAVHRMVPSGAPNRHSSVPERVKQDKDVTSRQKGDAAYRCVEVERRNKVRQEENIQRQEAIQKQVNDGFAAVKAERRRHDDQLFHERNLCKQWMLDGVPSPASSDRISLDLETAIGKQVLGLWETSRPSLQATQTRQAFIDRIQSAIDKRWPGQGLKVVAFGSSVTGLNNDTSDLDLVLLDPTRPFGVGTPPSLVIDPVHPVRHHCGLPDWYNVKLLAKVLKPTARQVYSIANARVPIIKMVDGVTGTPADVNVNERYGVLNSEMIRRYCELQPDIVRPLVYFLKHWLSRRYLNDPSGRYGPKSLSSYTIALMAIQYLQTQQLLPNLQAADLQQASGVDKSYLWSIPRQWRKQVNQTDTHTATTAKRLFTTKGYDTSFVQLQLETHVERKRAIEKVRAQVGNISDQEAMVKLLGHLVIGFIKYYQNFECRRYAISIANGAPLKIEPDLEDYDEEATCTDYPATTPSSLSAENTQSAKEPKAEDNSATKPDPAIANVFSINNFKQPLEWHRCPLIVQDPFIVDRNTAGNVNGSVIARLEGEMQRALLLLEGSQRETTKGRKTLRGKKASMTMQPLSIDKIPLIADVCVPTLN